jgi:SAM-dependent methyltransferase
VHGSVLGLFAVGALELHEVHQADVLEVGAMNVNGSVRDLVQRYRPETYVGVDLDAGPGVDRVVSASGLVVVFGPDSFDVVLSTEMLEHCEDWQAAIANMVAVLRPAGVMVLTTRSRGFGWHHPPDHWRYTKQTFGDIAERIGLEVVWLCDDPEYPGVFCKYRKPLDWRPPAHSDPLNGVRGVTPM